MRTKKIIKIVFITCLCFFAFVLPVSAEEVDTDIPNGSPQDSETTTNENEELIDEAQEQKQTIDTTIETPASVTGEKYVGNGTVVDFTTTGAKAFYTVQAKDNSVYYIIIDLDKTENNVYFLSQIDGEELNLADVTTKQTTTSPIETTQNANSQSGGGNTLFYLVLVVMASVVLLVGYHKKVKKKNPNVKFTDTVKAIFKRKPKEEPQQPATKKVATTTTEEKSEAEENKDSKEQEDNKEDTEEQQAQEQEEKELDYNDNPDNDDQ